MSDGPKAGISTTYSSTHPKLPEHLIGRARERKLAPGGDDAHSSGIARVSQDVFCESLVHDARVLSNVRKKCAQVLDGRVLRLR